MYPFGLLHQQGNFLIWVPDFIPDGAVQITHFSINF